MQNKYAFISFFFFVLVQQQADIVKKACEINERYTVTYKKYSSLALVVVVLAISVKSVKSRNISMFVE
jgi:hypothetical protein